MAIAVYKPRSQVILGKRTNPPGGREPTQEDAEVAEALEFHELGQGAFSRYVYSQEQGAYVDLGEEMLGRNDFDCFYGVKQWSNSDENTWPKPLRGFYYAIHTSRDARDVAKDIRCYYPEDLELLHFAQWLDFWADKGAHFENSS